MTLLPFHTKKDNLQKKYESAKKYLTIHHAEFFCEDFKKK